MPSYDVGMRASEENDAYNEKTGRLLQALEQNSQLLASLLRMYDGARADISDDALKQHVDEARMNVAKARLALSEHVTSPTHLSRRYRVINSDTGLDIDSFTEDFEVARWTAIQRMTESAATTFELLELQPDGTWCRI